MRVCLITAPQMLHTLLRQAGPGCLLAVADDAVLVVDMFFSPSRAFFSSSCEDLNGQRNRQTVPYLVATLCRVGCMPRKYPWTYPSLTIATTCGTRVSPDTHSNENSLYQVCIDTRYTTSTYINKSGTATNFQLRGYIHSNQDLERCVKNGGIYAFLPTPWFLITMKRCKTVPRVPQSIPGIPYRTHPLHKKVLRSIR